MVVVVASTVVAGTSSASARSRQPQDGANTGTTATGSIGVRLVDVPASGVDDPRARLYIVDQAAPGNTMQRRIEIRNTTTSPKHIELYAAAARIWRASFRGATGRTANELSTWTSVQPSSVDLLPGTSQIATVDIAIPNDASPAERYAAVWAETSTAPGAVQTVTQTTRVGIRVYVSVGPGGAPAGDFSVTSLQAERSPTGTPRIVATVHNIGGRALDLQGSLTLDHGPGGVSAGPFTVELGTTLGIGATAPVTILLADRLPAGPWSAHLILRSGLLARSAHARLTFPNSGSSRPVDTRSSDPAWKLALLLGIGGAALLTLAAMAACRYRRRGQDRRQRRSRGSPPRRRTGGTDQTTEAPRSPSRAR